MAQVLALALALTSLAPSYRAEGEGWCSVMRLTGYVRTEHGPFTYDGTSIYTDEPIAAASWDIPLQSMVEIDGLGSFRVADRGGGLGSYRWVDVAVWSRAEAFALTSAGRYACVYPPGGAP